MSLFTQPKHQGKDNKTFTIKEMLRLPNAEDDWLFGDALGATTVYIFVNNHDLKSRTLAYTA